MVGRILRWPSWSPPHGVTPVITAKEWLYGRPNHEPFHSKQFALADDRKGCRRDSKDVTHHCWLWRWREPHEKECGWPLETESDHQLTARNQEPQTYNHKELDSANNLDGLGNGASREKPSWCLDFILVRSSGENTTSLLRLTVTVYTVIENLQINPCVTPS